MIVLFLPLLGAGRTLPADAQEPAPNILVIVTDDQRDGTMDVMPKTLDLFSTGVEFSDAVATTPVCCPSRASIFTGQYAHNHDVRSNADGEAQNLSHDTTVQYYLHERGGYRTGLVGKFLNGWDVNRAPPYFDEYAITRGGYYHSRFLLGVEGTQKVRWSRGYSTNFVKRKALRFLERSEASDVEPWLLFVTPFAPHGPSISPPRYWDAEVPPFEPDPAMLEDDLSDKPPQYSKYAKPFDYADQEGRRGRQMRALMPVDDMVERLRAELVKRGEEDTLIVFMSDNGYMWGEHGLTAKATPYAPSVDIPMFLKWDGHVVPGVDARLAANIDVAPTVLDAAGITPDHPVDGRSLLEVWDRSELLTEVYGAVSRPELRWASILSADFQYVEYYGGDETITTFREYYDLTADPYQLENLLGDAESANDPNVADLSTRLARYRVCPLLTPCP